MKGRHRCKGGGFSDAFLSSKRYANPGESTRKQKQADGGGWGPRSYLKVQLRVPYSFPLEEEGAGGEKKASLTSPRPLNFKLLYLSVSVVLSEPLFSNKRHWLPSTTHTFLQNYSFCISVMRLVKWNNPELEWYNNFSGHILQNIIITTPA